MQNRRKKKQQQKKATTTTTKKAQERKHQIHFCLKRNSNTLLFENNNTNTLLFEKDQLYLDTNKNTFGTVDFLH